MSGSKWIDLFNIDFMTCFNLDLDQNIGLKILYLPVCS